MNSEPHWCEELYDAKAAELILYGRALGLGHGEAEDVLQETFVALMQMTVAPAKAEHYCVRSYRNRALNHKRSLWRRLAREALAGGHLCGHLFAEGHRWFERSPEEDVAERKAMQALATLPIEQREAIVLKVWHGCTFEEIGGILEISPNTAAGRYRYGLQKIKNKIEGVVYERDELERETTAFLVSAPGLKQA